MLRRLPRVSLVLALTVFASCADREDSPFDPEADRTPPELVSFDVVTQDQRAYAVWEASEPVRVVVEYNIDPAPFESFTRTAYPNSREFAAAGMFEIIVVGSDFTYEYAVRMRDRAGNEASQSMPGADTFTTGTIVPESPLILAMIDVGWGDALYVQAPDRTRGLIDCGHPLDVERVAEFFSRHAIASLDFAGLSHVHEDHIGGFYGDDFQGVPGLLERSIPVTRFLDVADKTIENGPYSNLQEVLDGNPTVQEHVFLRTGMSSANEPALFWGDGIDVTVLAAGRKPFLIPDFIVQAEQGSVINNDSIVYRVQYEDFVMMLTGDAEFASEQFLQNTWPREFLEASVLKLGHHGSNDSNSERFLDLVDPIVGFIPNAISENPGVEHPFVLSRLRNRGTDYFASDRAFANRDRAKAGVRGDMVVYTNGDAFTIVAENVRFE